MTHTRCRVHFGFRFYDDGFNSSLFGVLPSLVNSLYISFKKLATILYQRSFMNVLLKLNIFSLFLLLFIAFP